MANTIDELFADNDFVSTPKVARFAGISESYARSLAGDIGVGRVGPALVWDRGNVEDLMDQLEPDDESPDEEEDDDSSGEDEEPDDEEEDDDDE